MGIGRAALNQFEGGNLAAEKISRQEGKHYMAM